MSPSLSYCLWNGLNTEWIYVDFSYASIMQLTLRYKLFSNNFKSQNVISEKIENIALAATEVGRWCVPESVFFRCSKSVFFRCSKSEVYLRARSDDTLGSRSR